MGDFNEVLAADEHPEYPNVSVPLAGIKDFKEVVSSCSLTDLAYHGPKFIWWNHQKNNSISKKLNRVLISDTWLTSFPTSYALFDTGETSDHSRCLICLSFQDTHTRKHFQYFNVLTSLEGFLQIIGLKRRGCFTQRWLCIDSLGS